MENILNFSPAWLVKPVVNFEADAIGDLRLRILKIALDRSQIGASQSNNNPRVEDIVGETIEAIRELLKAVPDSENPILLHLHTQGLRVCGDAVVYMRAMINLWYIDTMPVLSRDPTQGVPEDGDTQWDSEYAAEHQHFGNLGLTAMLLTAENWKAPESQKLQAAALLANTTTSMVFAAYMISFRLDGDTWKGAVGKISSRVTIKAFFLCAWQVARINHGDFEGGPGREFGATSDEVKLAPDGKRLLSRIGRKDHGWHEPPFWHPCKKVPGSPWNKFLINKQQPVFTTEPSASSHILHRLPSTAIKLAEPYEEYYEELRKRIDASPANRTRLDIGGFELTRQHTSMASGTGLWYPDQELEEDVATEAYDVIQEYQYTVPLIKRPISDSRGNITLPFLASAARAFRFEIEPPETEPDLYMLLFGGVEGDVAS